MDAATDPWKPVDPLGEALHCLRMSGVFYCRSEFTEPFGLALPPMDGCLMFHAVVEGRCRVEIAEDEPVPLEPGGFVLVPHGRGHRLCSAPGVPAVPLFDLPREALSERYEILRHGGGGPRATVVCGAVRFDHPLARRLAALLPGTVVARAFAARSDWLHGTLRFMAAEAQALRPGGETVITRLADVLVIEAIRSWLAEAPLPRSGWLGALQDRQLGRALARIHREPARAWTVAELAREAAMSRSAFAARFAELVGETPMQYVARWRMQMAYARLQEGRVPIAGLAGDLGYRSEAAFSRAFKRFMGIPPGAVRAPSQP